MLTVRPRAVGGNLVESITHQRARDPNIVEDGIIPVRDPIKGAGHMRVLLDVLKDQFEDILRTQRNIIDENDKRIW